MTREDDARFSAALGPLLARLVKKSFHTAGRCAIGTRPIDLHLAGFEKFGAEVNSRRATSWRERQATAACMEPKFISTKSLLPD